jgi:hypothetical protein
MQLHKHIRRANLICTQNESERGTTQNRSTSSPEWESGVEKRIRTANGLRIQPPRAGKHIRRANRGDANYCGQRFRRIAAESGWELVGQGRHLTLTLRAASLPASRMPDPLPFHSKAILGGRVACCKPPSLCTKRWC